MHGIVRGGVCGVLQFRQAVEDCGAVRCEGDAVGFWPSVFGLRPLSLEISDPKISDLKGTKVKNQSQDQRTKAKDREPEPLRSSKSKIKNRQSEIPCPS